MKRRWLPLMVSAVALSGCYHQVVNTGRAPGPTIIDKPWVATWIFGLVAADPIDVRKECPTGVAVITTESSVANSLVGILTIGIFTPQHVTIQCATGTASIPQGATVLRLAAGATAEQSAKLVNEAVELARTNNAPVVIRMEPTLHGDER